jgi:hypothetical protein
VLPSQWPAAASDLDDLTEARHHLLAAGQTGQADVAAAAHLPLSDASDVQVRAHFDAAFLTQVSPARLNQVLQGATGIKLVSIQASEVSIRASEPGTLVAIVSTSGARPRAQAPAHRRPRGPDQRAAHRPG